jgi:hypothetical protein
MKKGYSAEWLTEEDFSIAASNGINYDIAYKRFYRYKWSREKTITEPIRKKGGSPKKALWWEYKDISIVSRSTFDYRVKHGMPPRLAALTEAGNQGGKKK